MTDLPGTTLQYFVQVGLSIELISGPTPNVTVLGHLTAVSVSDWWDVGREQVPTHTRIHMEHTPTGRRARVLEEYLTHKMNSKVTFSNRKSTTVEADAEPASSLSNGVDN